MKEIIIVWLIIIAFSEVESVNEHEILPPHPLLIEKSNRLADINTLLRNNLTTDKIKMKDDFEELKSNQIAGHVIEQAKFRKSNEILLNIERQLLTLINYARITPTEYSKLFLNHILSTSNVFAGSLQTGIIQWDWSLYSSAYLSSKLYYQLFLYEMKDELLANEKEIGAANQNQIKSKIEEMFRNFTEKHRKRGEVILLQYNHQSIIDLFNELICGVGPIDLQNSQSTNSPQNGIDGSICNLNLLDPHVTDRYRLLNRIYNRLAIGMYSNDDLMENFPEFHHLRSSLPFFRIIVIKLKRELPVEEYNHLIVGASYVVNQSYTSPSFLPTPSNSSEYILSLLIVNGSKKMVRERIFIGEKQTSLLSCGRFGYPSVLCSRLAPEDIQNECKEMYWQIHFEVLKLRYPKTGNYYHANFDREIDQQCSTINWSK